MFFLRGLGFSGLYRGLVVLIGVQGLVCFCGGLVVYIWV